MINAGLAEILIYAYAIYTLINEVTKYPFEIQLG